MKKLVSILVISLISASISSLIAQDNTRLSLDIGSAQENNMTQLMNYSWQRSAKAFSGGEEKVHSLIKVWFNSEGKMENSVLSSESTVKQQRGVRGRVQANAGEDMAALLEQTLGLTMKYIYLSKGSWIDLMDMAEVKMEEGIVKINAKNLLIEGDEVNYIIDNSIKLFRSVTISSLVGDKAFTSSIDFKTMSDGTNHPTHTEIIIPTESLKITSENIDYIKQQ